MDTNRRSFLTLAATGSTSALAGCSSGNTDTGLQVEEYEIQATNRTCTEENAHSTHIVTREPTAIEAKGTIAAPQRCHRLSTGALVSVQREDPQVLYIHVRATEDDERDCDSCSAQIEYQLRYELNQFPDRVEVEHRFPERRSPTVFTKRADTSG